MRVEGHRQEIAKTLISAMFRLSALSELSFTLCAAEDAT